MIATLPLSLFLLFRTHQIFTPAIALLLPPHSATFYFPCPLLSPTTSNIHTPCVILLRGPPRILSAMGKPLQCEGPLVDGLQQQCHATVPLSVLEARRKPSSGSASLASPEDRAHAHDGFPSFTILEQPGWDSVAGLETQQRQALQKITSKGVFWKHPTKALSAVFSLHHGGEVDADGNCLFTASKKAMSLQILPEEVRSRTVKRFLVDYNNSIGSQQAMNMTIRNLYSPELTTGWGVHAVQELKLLANKADREAIDAAIEQLVQVGMTRETAAETVYKERCIAINDGKTWAKYMSIAGNPDDTHDIITLQYTEEGLLSVDEDREGRSAAFGDDIAIESLATEFEREIFVVQAHGSDGMVGEESCVFFLPHPPRGEIQHLPAFLFMKGTGWCGAGADHYEPLIAFHVSQILQEKAAIIL